MMRRLTRWILARYPHWWRERYGEEAGATLADLNPGIRDVGNALAGLVDAWLFQYPPRELHRLAPEFHQVLLGAQREAFRLHHDRIGTEHFLLAILADREGRACRLLTAAGVTAAKVRHLIAAGDASRVSVNRLPAELWMTPRAKRTVERSMEDADRLGATHVTPDHLLLAMIEQPGGIGPRILIDLGVDPDLLRAALSAD